MNSLVRKTSTDIKVIVDHREVGGRVVNELRRLGIHLEPRQLEVGDFILSDRIGVERKSLRDFVKSIMDRRLMDQARRLREIFECPLLVVEGFGQYSVRIHPHALLGAMVAVIVDLGVPVVRTQDSSETASLLALIAKREQEGFHREVSLRGKRKWMSLPQSQRFVVEGLPGVSSVLARRLLEHFGKVERIMTASEHELRKVRGIGKKKAREIRDLLESEYEPEGD